MRSCAAASPTTDSSHNTSLSSKKRPEKIWYVGSLGSMLASHTSERKIAGREGCGVVPLLYQWEQATGESYHPVSSLQLLSMLGFAQSADCCNHHNFWRHAEKRKNSSPP